MLYLCDPVNQIIPLLSLNDLQCSEIQMLHKIFFLSSCRREKASQTAINRQKTEGLRNGKLSPAGTCSFKKEGGMIYEWQLYLFSSADRLQKYF